ncbi:hypothetical protein BV378_32970 [Nostoc sp. RF31YmG]|jgi:hypothetical protein|nr:hypothetical protein BV378_32970 [Nostoc sp. RF31YmG]
MNATDVPYNPLVGYFEVKIVKHLLGKRFKLNISKDIILLSGHIIWQSTLVESMKFISFSKNTQRLYEVMMQYGYIF